jgi:hypothetical protein
MSGSLFAGLAEKLDDRVDGSLGHTLRIRFAIVDVVDVAHCIEHFRDELGADGPFFSRVAGRDPPINEPLQRGSSCVTSSTHV